MSYQDNGYSFMFILNSEWETKWQLHNARGHVAIGLAANLGEKAKLLDYAIPAMNASAKISHWPVIDKTGSQKEMNRTLIELQEAQKHHELTFNLFTDSMFGASAAEQLQQTKEAMNPTALAIGIFGESEVLRKLTKRLSLAKY